MCTLVWRSMCLPTAWVKAVITSWAELVFRWWRSACRQARQVTERQAWLIATHLSKRREEAQPRRIELVAVLTGIAVVHLWVQGEMVACLLACRILAYQPCSSARCHSDS